MKNKKIFAAKLVWIILVFLSIIIIFPELSFSEWEDVVDQFDSTVKIFPQTNNANFSGAASNSIPIIVPPGRNGVQPNLSLVYNSYAKNSCLGVGWDLGIGYIQRSTKFGLNYSGTDFVASFDGSKTELASLGSNYYAAKIESTFTKYELKSDTAGWEVTTRDGTKYFYGRSASTRQQNPSNSSQVFAWYLDKVIDTNGNYMTISYQTGSGNDIYPDTIEYTGNVSLAPSYTIKFHLQNISTLGSTLVPSYVTKYKVTKTKILKTIEVLYGTDHVRAYVLEYSVSDDSKRPLLEKVRQYGSNYTIINGTVTGGSSLPATTLSYTEYETEDFNFSETLVSSGYDFYTYKTADFNGDGKTDYYNFWIDPEDPMYTQNHYIRISNGNGTFNTSIFSGETSTVLHFGDFNGDGKTDMLNNHVWFSNGNGTFTDKGSVGSFFRTYYTPGDFNGDGLTDFMANNGFEPVYEGGAYPSYYIGAEWHVYLSNGDGSFAYKGIKLSSSEWDPYVIPADFNGDGRTDFIVNSNDETNALLVYLAIGENGDFSYAGYIPNSDAENWDDPQIGDFNGDGMSDLSIYDTLNEKLYIYFSKGNGTFEYKTSFAGYYYSFSEGIGDFNGDGFSDIVIHQGGSASERYWKVFLSNGDGTFRTSTTLTSRTSHYLRAYAGDYNADGIGDLLLADAFYYGVNYPTPDEVYVCLSDTSAETNPDLLKTVLNSYGGTLKFTYKPSTEYNNIFMPFITQTLSSTNNQDGIGGSYTTSFSYSGGLYAPGEREFRGFHKVTKINPDSSKSITTYFQDEYNKGKPDLKEYLDENSKKFGDVDYTWEPITVSGASKFVRLIQKDTTFIDGQTLSTIEQYEYDHDCGLVTKKTSYDESDLTKKLITETDWVNIDEAYDGWTWRVDGERIRDFSDSSNLRETTYEYDENGNLINKYYTLSYNGETERTLTETFEYDEYGYGNIVGGSYPNGNLKPSIVYDDATQTYPSTITNALEQVTQVTYNPLFGIVEQETNPNLNSTYYEIDEFGRVVLISYPDGGTTATDYHPEARPMYVKKSVTEPDGGSIDSYAYYDGLGREIQNVSFGISDVPVVTKTSYDSMGRAYFQEGPFFSNNKVPTIYNGISFSYWEMNPISSNYPWTKVDSYDARNRPLEVISPDGSAGVDTSNISITYSYSGLNTTITDPDENKKKEGKDFLGRLIKVHEYLNDNELVTEYNYNAAGNLESVVDAAGNTITNTYDTLGRKRSMDDPDMGYWTYTYDDNGNLDIQTDANEHRIKLHHDELDRVKQKEYLDTDDLDVYYEYGIDRPDVPNGIGQLCSIQKSDGETQFEAETSYEEFDEMGRAITVTKSITGLSEEYTTKYYYDIAGRLEEVVYPDEYSVGYEYHPGTFLLHRVNAENVKNDEIETYLHASITDYTASGKICDIYDGSNAETRYEYDEKSTRLTGIYTELDELTVLQNKNYVYTKAGNISTILDNLEGAEYNYGYDELHRLTSETPDGPVQTFKQMQAFPDYDGIGPVHAVKTIIVPGETYSYDYDDNGNMIEGWDLTDPLNVVFRSFDYNTDNMPTTIVHGTDTTNYIYDGEGNRVKKVVNDTISTYYINELFEIENGSNTKYIFAGNLRIAMVDDSGTYYFQKDHLGSTAAITKYDDSLGGIVHDNNLEQYLPFGGQRSSTSVIKTNYTFTDQERDPESGLYNYDARLYDPVIGQFITPDSIVPDPFDPQLLNRYSYCRNNPLIYVDPSGHALWGFCIDGQQVGEFWGTAWYVYDYPDTYYYSSLSESSTEDKNADVDYIEDSKEVEKMMQNQPEGGYDTYIEAAQEALQVINPQSTKIDREYGGWIYEKDGRYFFTEPKQGTQHKMNLGPKPANAVAYYHSHGARTSSFDEIFSSLDKKTAGCKSFWYNGEKRNGACVLFGYLITPSGRQLQYDPNEKWWRWRQKVTEFTVLKLNLCK